MGTGAKVYKLSLPVKADWLPLTGMLLTQLHLVGLVHIFQKLYRLIWCKL